MAQEEKALKRYEKEQERTLREALGNELFDMLEEMEESIEAHVNGQKAKSP